MCVFLKKKKNHISWIICFGVDFFFFFGLNYTYSIYVSTLKNLVYFFFSYLPNFSIILDSHMGL